MAAERFSRRYSALVEEGLGSYTRATFDQMRNLKGALYAGDVDPVAEK